ncbi:DUF5333 family protein [Chachezhania antarctica]|uniref:DUF5333 family protein n=1 Tax=Chachezhania antarctica TaxID=2340860 RepID=UPI0013CE4B9C|nr:DUF5333 family protein [Chachezhania antarctica]
MINPVRIFFAGALAAALASCTATPVPVMAPPPGATAKTAVESYIRVVSTAQAIAESCSAYGITLAFDDRDAMTQAYIAQLIDAGFTQAEIETAFNTINRDRISADAVRYMDERGAKKGDRESFCAVGASEIEKGTAVGRLLSLS